MRNPRVSVLLASVILIIIVLSTVYFYMGQKPLQPTTSPITSITEIVEQPGKKKIVIYAYNDDITGIDPSIEDDTGLVVIGVVYETLTYYDHQSGEVKPRLAIKWESYENNTVWVFRLREGVVFHDGTPFNATAVKISVERARDIYRATGRGLGYIWDAVREVIIEDEYTVKFVLEYPQRLDLMAAASYSAYIFSPSVLAKSNVDDYLDEKLVKWFNEGNAIGTGPYVLEYYNPASEVRLRKFDKWWGWSIVNNTEAPDIVVIRIIKDPQSQYNGLLAGEIDIACSVPREMVSILIDKGFKYRMLPTFHNYILFFNTRRYPTNIVEFRKAILHAINITEAVQLSMRGFALEGSGIVPHGFPGFVEGLKYEFNTSKSLEYLELSGVKTPINIEILYQVDYEESAIFAEYLKSRLVDLGINVILVPRPWSQLKDIAKNIWDNPEETPHLILADWWPTILSPYDYLYTMFHSESKEWNFAGYENPEFDELIDTAWRYEGSNYEEAMRLYHEAQGMIFEEAVAVNLWDEIRPFIYKPSIDIPESALNPLYMYVIRFEYVKVGA
ncbi:MAG: ABC transporter substrate-binding protein [Desulfurococcaceae archaeon]